ncbi:MAG: potassium channel protein [Myxococcales bacterium]|nr:MAG: potassium channel protein [Myxococcales bacterium]
MAMKLHRLHVLSRRLLFDPPSQLRLGALLTSVLLYGATGYVYFEGEGRPELRLADGFWWALVTMTTIGYGDHFPTTAPGRFLVGVPLMLFGVGMLGYALSLASIMLIEAKTKELRGMTTVRLKKHIVIVNYPGLDKVVRLLDELHHPDALGSEATVVLVDEELPELPVELKERGVQFVRGNPTREPTLVRASVGQASEVVVLVKRPFDPHSDHQVIAVSLVLRSSFRGVPAIVECVDEATVELLQRAGCTRVVCMARFNTSFLMNELVQPGSQEVVEDLLSNGGQQIFLSPPGAVPGATFAAASAALTPRGHLAIGLRRGAHTMLNPPASTPLEPDDRLVTIGISPLVR